MEREAPSLSPGELQRLRLATQIRSHLFGVVYVLDEPSAGLHPVDTESLLRALVRLKAAGNSLFVAEHEPDVIRRADWIVDVGPGAGQYGGRILYSGPVNGLSEGRESETAKHLFTSSVDTRRAVRRAESHITLRNVSCNNSLGITVSFPVRLLTTVTGVSGSGKSSLVTQALTQLLGAVVGREAAVAELDDALTEASFTVVHGAVEFEQARSRTLFIQRGEGSVRTVRGAGCNFRRATLPARCVLTLSGLRQLPVQYEDAERSPAGQEYRRSLVDDS